MIREHELRKGAWVIYIPTSGTPEIGRIKKWNDQLVFVVYQANEDWDNYESYTGAGTDRANLSVVLKDAPIIKREMTNAE